jgi:hypothetical protein
MAADEHGPLSGSALCSMYSLMTAAAGLQPCPAAAAGFADHNAAVVIAARGVERWGEVMRPHAQRPP